MLRQRRFSQRSSLSHSLNLYSNQNFQLATSGLEPPHKNSFGMLEPKLQKKTNRKGLGQIDKNNNNRKDITDEGWLSKNSSYQSKERYEPIHTSKEQQHLFNRISDLIRHQQNGSQVGKSPQVQKFSLRKQRPYTSLSNRNKMSHDMSILGKYQVVLDLAPQQEQKQIQDPSKVSTSRALMNFSKVYRNSTGYRFKVRRDKYVNHLSLISTQKVILLEKEKVSRKDIEKLPQQPPSSLKKRRQSRLSFQKNPPVKRRYFEEQEFQIDGWEYFE